jgi:hypothetical protein
MSENSSSQKPPLNLKEPACWNCKFWKRKSDNLGECHRNAPQIVTTTESRTVGETGVYREVVESYTRSEWPTTKDSNWCGEFLHTTVET